MAISLMSIATMTVCSGSVVLGFIPLEAAMTATQRVEVFKVEEDYLIRKMVPRLGRPYQHRCPHTSFEQFALAID